MHSDAKKKDLHGVRKNVLNPNKAQSPLKNIGFDRQFKSSTELAKQYNLIAPQKLAKDSGNRAMKEQSATLKRKKPTDAISNVKDGRSAQRLVPSEESIKLQGKNKVPSEESSQQLGRSKLPMQQSVQQQRRGKLPIQSSSKEVLNTSHVIARSQGEREKELDIRRMQNLKKNRPSVLPSSSLGVLLEKQGIHVEGGTKLHNRQENDIRSTASPLLDDENIEEDDFAAQEEVDEDDCVRDEAIDIDGAAGGTSEKKKVRGKTNKARIHTRNFEDREEVTFDGGQPVGPTNTRVSDLTNFIGTIARNPRFVTLLYTSWHDVPKDTKERMWEYVNNKFIIPAEGKKWVMIGLRDAWRGYKKRVKKNHFKKYETIEDMLKNRPQEIPEPHFRQLIEYWSLPDVQATADLNSQNRKKQQWRHRMGPINFARVRVALREQNENKEEPSQCEMFVATRTKSGKGLQTDTQNAINELQDLQDAGYTADDAFKSVFGKEKPGRVRCYGRSVTASSLKKDEEINKLKQKHANEILSMKEEMKEEMREEMREEMKEQMKEQMKLLFSQLVQNNPGLNIPDIPGCAGSNAPSPVDTSGAREMRGQNLQTSSGSMQSAREKEHGINGLGKGSRKKI